MSKRQTAFLIGKILFAAAVITLICRKVDLSRVWISMRDAACMRQSCWASSYVCAQWRSSLALTLESPFFVRNSSRARLSDAWFLFMDVFRPLPYSAGLINRMILKAIAASPFIRDAKKNHGAPERRVAQI